MILVIPKGHGKFVDRNMLYTAVTRAKKTNIIICDPDVLRAAMRQPPKLRETLQLYHLNKVFDEGLVH